MTLSRYEYEESVDIDMTVSRQQGIVIILPDLNHTIRLSSSLEAIP